jgi:hypothetical protein
MKSVIVAYLIYTIITVSSAAHLQLPRGTLAVISIDMFGTKARNMVLVRRQGRPVEQTLEIVFVSRQCQYILL